MSEPVKKRVDESWKEQAEREKQTVTSAPQNPASQAGPAPAQGAGPAPAQAPQAAHEHGHEEETLQARFDLFLQGLAVEALIGLGDMAHPATKKQAVNLTQAKYIIDLLGLLEEKTKGNLTADEAKMLKDVLYQLRMRYLNKSGGVAPAP